MKLIIIKLYFKKTYEKMLKAKILIIMPFSGDYVDRSLIYCINQAVFAVYPFKVFLS